jgi:lysophospholipase L1-like esterase
MKSQRSTILSPDGARTAGSLLASLCALVVVTCASVAQGPVPRVAAASPGASPPSGSAAPRPAPSPAANSASLPRDVPARGAELARFRAALAELERGARKEPVRVLWLGDSHAAADFWPDAVRKPLQARFGAGGPGFLFLGLGVYRHAGVKVGRDGSFHVQPRQPSLWLRQDDGVFGLGGMRVVPVDAKSRATLTLTSDAVRSAAKWDLSYRLPSQAARFHVRVDGGESRVVDAKSGAVGAIQHLEWDTPRGATVIIDGAEGEPQIFGVAVESAAPGVVVDTLGINGARIGTPLASEAGPWVAEAARRRPSLVVLAYGTNEVGDQVAPRRYGSELESLVARVRQASPGADCLVVGPTDREGPGWTPLPRVVEIDAVERQAAEHVGCAFFSAYDAMGGEGSLKRWADQAPPLAASDHVHLTPRGYGELGGLMASMVLGEGASGSAPASPPTAAPSR